MNFLPPFDYHRPTSLGEALGLLQTHGREARILAGGTDLLAKLRSGSLVASHLVSLSRVEELNAITFDEKAGLTIGAAATVSEVGRHAAVRACYPVLASGCSVLATPQIRNMATVAGNLANAAPCADTACPLHVYDARLVIASASGEREVPLAEFFRGPGAVNLEAGEMVKQILVPPPPAGAGGSYQRISGRSRVDISAAMTAALVVLDADQKKIATARLALGSVAPTPMRAREAEAILVGAEPTPEVIERAAQSCEKEAAPIDDVRASAVWRTVMVRVLSQRAITEAVAAAQGGSQ